MTLSNATTELMEVFFSLFFVDLNQYFNCPLELEHLLGVYRKFLCIYVKFKDAKILQSAHNHCIYKDI